MNVTDNGQCASGTRRVALFAGVAFFASWLVANSSRLWVDQDGAIRFILGTAFAAAILLRPLGPARFLQLCLGWPIPGVPFVGPDGTPGTTFDETVNTNFTPPVIDLGYDVTGRYFQYRFR